MKDTRHKETEFDELDAAIAAALGDASAWSVPCAGFEERCVAHVERILEEGEKRRPFLSFGGGAFLKVAASLAVMLGGVSIVLNAIVGSDPQVPTPGDAGIAAYAGPTANDIGSKCERMVKVLEREKSRKAAMEFLANVCMAGDI